MPFNGSGTFNRLYSWVTDATNGIKIRADRMDNEMNGMATALSDCVTRDGQSPPSTNLPMGGFKHTNCADGASDSDYATVKQINDGFGVASGTATAIIITSTIPRSALQINQWVSFIATANSSGPTSLTVDGLAARTLSLDGVAVYAGAWLIGDMVIAKYNGAAYQLISPYRVYMKSANNLSDVITPATARLNLGLGNAAVKNVSAASAFPIPANLGLAAAFQVAYFGDGNGSLASTPFAYTDIARVSLNLSDLTSAATARTNLGLGSASTHPASAGGAGEAVALVATAVAGEIVFYNDNTGRLQSSGVQVSDVSRNSSNLSGLTNTATSRTNLGLGTGNSPTFAGLTINGAITATGDITAFASDDRLKNRDGALAGALHKLETLDVFFYKFNSEAIALGLPVGRHLGLSAQQLQKVVPEAIRQAPADPQYLTYQDRELIPLLVRAIQELSLEVKDLRSHLVV